MITEQELLADLAATFPGLNAQPLRTFGKNWTNAAGAWFHKPHFMPDGLPLFVVPFEVGNVEPEGYRCWVHEAFLVWLELRGWHLETYDYGTYLIVPEPALIDQLVHEEVA
ncbi:MAG: hypothetical protein V4864_16095 [Pseudomonadota bacterium]